MGIRIRNHDSDTPFYLSELETGFRIGWIILSISFEVDQSSKMAEMACFTVLFEQIRNMIPKQVSHTPFKFQNESSTSPESENHRIETKCL